MYIVGTTSEEQWRCDVAMFQCIDVRSNLTDIIYIQDKAVFVNYHFSNVVKLFYSSEVFLYFNT